MVSALPHALTRGGVIGTRQTTFWEVVDAEAGHRWRVRFRGKKETAFEGRAFDSATLISKHPLLHDHQEPRDALFISSPSCDPEALLAELRALCADLFARWRSLDRYLNPDYSALRMLAEGHGMLLHGPRTFVEACSTVLRGAGVRVDQPTRGAAPRAPTHLLLLGRSLVVAESFLFETLEGHG